jgi:hypothetical protein
MPSHRCENRDLHVVESEHVSGTKWSQNTHVVSPASDFLSVKLMQQLRLKLPIEWLPLSISP